MKLPWRASRPMMQMTPESLPPSKIRISTVWELADRMKDAVETVQSGALPSLHTDVEAFDPPPTTQRTEVRVTDSDGQLLIRGEELATSARRLDMVRVQAGTWIDGEQPSTSLDHRRPGFEVYFCRTLPTTLNANPIGSGIDPQHSQVMARNLREWLVQETQRRASVTPVVVGVWAAAVLALLAGAVVLTASIGFERFRWLWLIPIALVTFVCISAISDMAHARASAYVARRVGFTLDLETIREFRLRKASYRDYYVVGGISFVSGLVLAALVYLLGLR